MLKITVLLCGSQIVCTRTVTAEATWKVLKRADSPQLGCVTKNKFLFMTVTGRFLQINLFSCYPADLTLLSCRILRGRPIHASQSKHPTKSLMHLEVKPNDTGNEGKRWTQAQTRQNKTRQGKTGENTSQDKTRESKTRQDKTTQRSHNRQSQARDTSKYRQGSCRLPRGRNDCGSHPEMAAPNNRLAASSSNLVALERPKI